MDNTTKQDFDETLERLESYLEELISKSDWDGEPSPDVFVQIRQIANVLCAALALKAQQRVHQNVLELARRLPNVERGEITNAVTGLTAIQGRNEVGQRLSARLDKRFHQVIWSWVLPGEWTVVDRSNYADKIMQTAKKRKPGIDAIPDSEQMEILSKWLPYHQKEFTQTEFCELQGWESRTPLRAALRWWRDQHGKDFPEGFS